MSRELTAEAILLRAKDAGMILNHQLVKDAFEDVRELYVKSIENCDLRDDKVRDKLMMGLKMLKAVRNQLQSHIETGKMAGIEEINEL